MLSGVESGSLDFVRTKERSRKWSSITALPIADNITSYVGESDKVTLRSAYRKHREEFRANDVVSQLNEKVKQNVHILDKCITFGVRDNGVDGWKNDFALIVDEIPYENVGVGSQNTIKVELVLQNNENDINVLLVEEPENNLSYGNMSKLIARVNRSTGKQIFISTHSSYVANKLGLRYIMLVSNGIISSFNNLPDDTMDYFKKLPGYDTLRVILANEVILVEGPTDDLIIQRAYRDAHGKLPIEDGIDVITVDALSFKRYCDLARLVDKKVKVVTDNDGDISKNIDKKYKDYIGKSWFSVYYETEEILNTIEPSVLASNWLSFEQQDSFRKAISKNGSMNKKTREEILEFMLNNKAEWSMRVFDSDTKIMYPQYIQDAIKK